MKQLSARLIGSIEEMLKEKFSGRNDSGIETTVAERNVVDETVVNMWHHPDSDCFAKFPPGDMFPSNALTLRTLCGLWFMGTDYRGNMPLSQPGKIRPLKKFCDDNNFPKKPQKMRFARAIGEARSLMRFLELNIDIVVPDEIPTTAAFVQSFVRASHDYLTKLQNKADDHAAGLSGSPRKRRRVRGQTKWPHTLRKAQLHVKTLLGITELRRGQLAVTSIDVVGTREEGDWTQNTASETVLQIRQEHRENREEMMRTRQEQRQDLRGRRLANAIETVQR